MSTSSAIPLNAQLLSSYLGERIQGVSFWLLDTDNKTMILARSTNVEGLLLRFKIFEDTGKASRVGDRIKAFIAGVVSRGSKVYWIKNGFTTEQYLKNAGFKEIPRFSNQSKLSSNKVMIKGKVLQITHLKSNFALVCAVEPRDLKEVLVTRLTRACETIHPSVWNNASSVRVFLERFTKNIIETKDGGRMFATKFVDLPVGITHRTFVIKKNEDLTNDWLERKGFKPKPNRFQKEYTDVTNQKDSSHRFALGH